MNMDEINLKKTLLNKEIEDIKKNEIEIMQLKDTVTEMKSSVS